VSDWDDEYEYDDDEETFDEDDDLLIELDTVDNDSWWAAEDATWD
jgi:hypothetical protein